MIAILCLDDCGGMLFNHRRQSRDRVLVEDICSAVGNSVLWIRPFSESLFPKESFPSLRIHENALLQAGTNEFCFLEDLKITPEHCMRMEKIILYRWNRHYPGDLFFDLNLSALGFCLQEKKDFEGSSHPQITKEVWSK